MNGVKYKEVTYFIGTNNLNSKEAIKKAVENLGFSCYLEKFSSIACRLIINVPIETSDDVILSLGVHIGSLQTKILMDN